MKSCSSSLIIKKGKSKLQWGTTSHQFEWLLLKSLQIRNSLVVKWLKKKKREREKEKKERKKNLPSSARNMGLIPGLEKSHMPQRNQACVPAPLSLCSRAQGPKLLSSGAKRPKPVRPGSRAQQWGEPLQWDVCSPHERGASCSPQPEKSPRSHETWHSQK